ncbi:lantibiotic dehydratase [Ktedonospora formicarum]|uniref:Lantibiotic dehydratase n=1 Tax=Ktedonospora formicarum TaxID=2778364 RepID=A0A8J3I4K7_9CHLR|nr:lantibiotic dehydratase [Ktedonospora formicarum]GHO48591.1 hypothetical protein KSX_67540 [Ktedonospora formicarum]
MKASQKKTERSATQQTEMENDTGGKGAPLYQDAGYFLVRAPLFSTRLFSHLAQSEEHETRSCAQQRHTGYTALYELFQQSPSLQVALVTASLDLYDGLARLPSTLSTLTRRTQRTLSRLLRYGIRGSTRSTPFGLFAGIALGTFGEHSQLVIAQPVVKHIRLRPDTGWLFSMIRLLEQDLSLLPHMQVLVNTTTVVVGPRVITSCANISGEEHNSRVSFRTNPFVLRLLELTRQPIAYEQLVAHLCHDFPQLPEASISQLLAQLWSSHVLLLPRPPLTTPEPARDWLQCLTSLPYTTRMHAEVEGALAFAEQMNTGGLTTLIEHQSELLAWQRRIFQTYQQQAFQVDAALAVQTPVLSQRLARVAAQAAELLLRVSPWPQGSPVLAAYRAAFVRKYGTAEVPLLQLLSDEHGLGAPPTYGQPSREAPLLPAPPMPYDAARIRLLCALLVQAVQAHTLEVQLTDEQLARLARWSASPQHPAPPSLEVFLQVQATSKAALDEGTWERVVVPMVTFGGRTMGRFVDLLGAEGLAHLRSSLRAEEAMYPDVLFVDLNYLPMDGRCANVALHQPLHTHEIVVNTSPSLPPEQVIALDDLVVGVRQQRFYVRSLRLGKDIKVFQHNMLNTRYAPNVCRFLLDVAWDGSPSPSSFDWETLSEAPFLPRLTYRDITFSLAQWQVQWTDLCSGDMDGTNEDDRFAALQRWRTKWQVPRYVWMTHLDQRLLLDLESPLMAHELFEEMKHRQKRSKKVQLQEMLPDLSHLWLHDTQGAPYVAELVVPVQLRQPGEERTATNCKEQHPRHPVPSRSERLILPGEAWISLKLYAAFSFHDLILRERIAPLIASLRAQGRCDQWFYVRYADPEPHLRLRLHLGEGRAPEQLFLPVLAWVRELLSEGFLTDVQVASYEREIERYGGPEAIEHIERFFSVNSDAMLSLLDVLTSKMLTLDPIVVAVICLDHLFATWGYDLEARLHYARQRTEPYEAGEVFRTHRAQLLELLVPWRMHSTDPLWLQREHLLSLLAPQDAVVEVVRPLLDALLARGALWQPKEAVIGSLAHMQHNRLLPVSPSHEKQVVALWRQSLEAIHKRPGSAAHKTRHIPSQSEQGQ